MVCVVHAEIEFNDKMIGWIKMNWWKVIILIYIVIIDLRLFEIILIRW